MELHVHMSVHVCFKASTDFWPHSNSAAIREPVTTHNGDCTSIRERKTVPRSHTSPSVYVKKKHTHDQVQYHIPSTIPSSSLHSSVHAAIHQHGIPHNHHCLPQVGFTYALDDSTSLTSLTTIGRIHRFLRVQSADQSNVVGGDGSIQLYITPQDRRAHSRM